MPWQKKICFTCVKYCLRFVDIEALRCLDTFDGTLFIEHTLYKNIDRNTVLFSQNTHFIEIYIRSQVIEHTLYRNIDWNTIHRIYPVKNIDCNTVHRIHPVQNIDLHTVHRIHPVKNIDYHTIQRTHPVKNIDYHTIQRTHPIQKYILSHCSQNTPYIEIFSLLCISRYTQNFILENLKILYQKK